MHRSARDSEGLGRPGFPRRHGRARRRAEELLVSLARVVAPVLGQRRAVVVVAAAGGEWVLGVVERDRVRQGHVRCCERGEEKEQDRSGSHDCGDIYKGKGKKGRRGEVEIRSLWKEGMLCVIELAPRAEIFFSPIYPGPDPNWATGVYIKCENSLGCSC